MTLLRAWISTFSIVWISTVLGSTSSTESVECGAKIDSFSREEVGAFLLDLTSGSEELQGLVAFGIIPNLQSGIEVRKICGSCADYPNPTLCPPTVYGFDVAHSGLLVSPTNDDGTMLKEGTSMLNIHFHGALRHIKAGPSDSFPPNIFVGSGFDVFLALAFSATTGTYTIVPDYQGFGESALKLFPSTLVRQGYVTATWPLIEAAKKWVTSASNCASAIGKEALLTGYSEGGYASVAVMDALSKTDDVKVVQVDAGAGAFRTSRQLVEGFRSFSTPDFVDPDLRFVTTWTALPFSSTTTDVANFGAGQDVIDPAERSRVLQAVQESDDDDDLNSLTNPDDPFGFYNPVLVDALQLALETGENDICQSDLLVVGETDILCEAITDQDLVEVLENTDVQVTLYHSQEDELIPILNLPNVDGNDFLTFIPLVGGHITAGGQFFSLILQQRFLGANRISLLVQVEDITVEGGCPVVETNSPTSAPTGAPEGEENDLEDDDAKFKATIICEGGRIAAEAGDEPVTACKVGDCRSPKILIAKKAPHFDLAAMIPIQCDAQGTAGLCARKNGKWTLMDRCPYGEHAITTITRDQKARRLRGMGQNLSEEEVEIGGETVTVFSIES